MYQTTILYGHPVDEKAFLRHYESVHQQIGASVPGLFDYRWAKCETLDGSCPPYFLIAQLSADSKEAYEAALQTPECRAAFDDLANFATGDVTIFYGEVHIATSPGTRRLPFTASFPRPT